MGFFLAFMSAILFTMNSMLLKKGMRVSERDNGVFMSITVNVLVLGAAWLVYRIVVESPPALTLAGLFFFVLSGVLTTYFGRTTLFAGIRRIGPSRAVAVKNTSPVFTLLFAVIVLRETYGFWPWVGLFIIIAGLSLQGLQLFYRTESKVNQIGLLFSVLAALGFGFGQGVRKLGLGFVPDAFAGAFIGAVVAFVAFAVSETANGRFLETVKSNLQLKNKYYLAAGLMSSMAVLCFFLSIQYIPVAYAGAIAATEPVLTMLCSKWLLKGEERITPVVIATSVLIFLGAGVIAYTG